MKPTPLRIALLFVAASCCPLLGDPENSLVTSVYSGTADGYQRPKGADGKFKREYYAISNGGALPGTTRDHAIDKVQFPQLAGVLAQFLGRQNYFLAKDSKSADLLLVVHWGTTMPFSDPGRQIAVDQASAAMMATRQFGSGAETGKAFTVTGGSPENEALENAMMELMMFEKMRDQANARTARLLGYLQEINSVNDIRRYAGGGNYYDDLRADLEEPRYYVIITAYDFRETVQKKNEKRLWTTRVSIRAQGNSFEKQFAAMLAKASRHFGQKSGRLLRQYDADVRVDIGELEVVGVSPAAEKK